MHGVEYALSVCAQSKAKRRYVCGLKEVLKHLKLKKIKCVVMPPNLDRIQSEGEPITEATNNASQYSYANQVMFLWAGGFASTVCMLLSDCMQFPCRWHK